MKRFSLGRRTHGLSLALVLSGFVAMFVAGRAAFAQSCDLYPIALSAQSLSNAAPGAVLCDIFNGAQSGGFGWLSWAAVRANRRSSTVSRRPVTAART